MKLLDNLAGSLAHIGGSAKLKLVKAAPDIALAAGILGFVATAVVASKQTLTAEDILDKHKENMDKIHKAKEEADYGVVTYTDEQMQKDTAVVYSKTIVAMAKHYAPAVALGVASTACIIWSHSQMKSRYLSAVAAYGAIDKAFKTYRERVKEKLGSDADAEFRYGLERKTVAEEIVDEDGNKKTEVHEEVQPDPDISGYAKFFDEFNPNWKKDAGMNRTFIHSVQNWANDLLRIRGYLFLNEVYDALGIPPTKSGQIVGWIDSKDHPKVVDFFMLDRFTQAKADFINEREKAILLDFNVDGPILDFVNLENI